MCPRNSFYRGGQRNLERKEAQHRHETLLNRSENSDRPHQYHINAKGILVSNGQVGAVQRRKRNHPDGRAIWYLNEAEAVTPP